MNRWICLASHVWGYAKIFRCATTCQHATCHVLLFWTFPEAMDPLDACRIIADEEVLKQLAKQQACVNLGTRALDVVATCWERDVLLQAVTDATGPKYQAERVQERWRNWSHQSLPFPLVLHPSIYWCTCLCSFNEIRDSMWSCIFQVEALDKCQACADGGCTQLLPVKRCQTIHIGFVVWRAALKLHVGGHGLLRGGCVRSLGAIGYNLGPDGETWHLWWKIWNLRLQAFLRLLVSLVITWYLAHFSWFFIFTFSVVYVSVVFPYFPYVPSFALDQERHGQGWEGHIKHFFQNRSYKLDMPSPSRADWVLVELNRAKANMHRHRMVAFSPSLALFWRRCPRLPKWSPMKQAASS